MSEHKPRKHLKMKLLFLFLIIATFFAILVAGVPRLLGPRDELQKADVIVAISGGDTEARTKEAIRLYQEGWAHNLLFSGAASDPASPSNAEVMKNEAIEAGIAPTAIDIEENAQDTLGNASFSADLVKNKGYKSIILVTSEYHQRRAWLEFRHYFGNDVTIINHPTPDDRKWPGALWWLNPPSFFIGTGETVKTLYVWGRYSL